MRDLRDQEALGALILAVRHSKNVSVCEAADFAGGTYFTRVPLIGEADGVYIGPIERYGDPRERHAARIGGC